MLMVAHEVAGRLRFASPVLKGDGRQAGQLERQVRAVPGVTDVQVRRNTGSMIVLHDGAQATRLAVLRTLGIAAPLQEAPRPRLLDELIEAAAQQLLSLAARGVIAALL
jgi:Heavy metal associated domain 2